MEDEATYELVIGLEVHAQLHTHTKIFSSDSNSFGDEPNTNVSVVSLGHPGVMPMLNKKAVEYAIRMGLACDSSITRLQYFDRKNYFYPDLPKGYQITQDKTPICVGGTVLFMYDGDKHGSVELNRIHLEEDAGKSIHQDGSPESLIDLNRAGVPLIEIVTEPVIRTAEEAGAFLAEIRRKVRYLDICDGNMEEGSLRCDANVSIRLPGDKKLGQKVELKNMNSIKHVIRAIEHEYDRQVARKKAGKPIISETRTYDVSTGDSFGMRTKEALNDYRYFPEPDLSPLVVTDEWMEEIQKGMPKLPAQFRMHFMQDYGLNEYDAQVLTDRKEMAYFYEELCSQTPNQKAAANWLMGPVKSYLNEHGQTIEDFPLGTQTLAGIIKLIDDREINHSSANQQLFPYLLKHPGKDPKDAAEELNLIQHHDDSLVQDIIKKVLDANEKKVKEYKKGKKGLIGMFMGQLMKESKGQIDPKTANELLTEALDKR